MKKPSKIQMLIPYFFSDPTERSFQFERYNIHSGLNDEVLVLFSDGASGLSRLPDRQRKLVLKVEGGWNYYRVRYLDGAVTQADSTNELVSARRLYLDWIALPGCRLGQSVPPHESMYRRALSESVRKATFVGALDWSVRRLGIEARVVMNDEFSWSEPFDSMFSGDSSVAEIHRKLLEKCCLLARQGQRDAALREAEYWTCLLCEEVTVPWFVTFERRLKINPTQATTDFEALVSAELDSPNQVRRSPIYKSWKTHKKITVTRVYGWLGLFWWSFLCDLRDAEKFSECRYCGSLFTAKKRDSQRCSKPVCLTARNKLRKRLQRDALDRSRSPKPPPKGMVASRV